MVRRQESGTPVEGWPGRRVIGLRVIGVLVVLMLLAAGAGALVVQFFQQRSSGTTIIDDRVARFVAAVDVGDVRVRPAPAGSPVQVTSTELWSFRRPHVRTAVAGGVLRVTGDCSGLFWTSGLCRSDVEVALPGGVPIEIRTRLGDIRVTGTSGAIVAEADTGDIDLTAAGALTVHADTGSGDVTVIGGTTDCRVQATVGTGDIRLRLGAPPAEVLAETGTGDITISVPTGDAYRVDADAGTGDVRVRVPRDESVPRSMLATSGTGDVTIRAD